MRGETCNTCVEMVRKKDCSVHRAVREKMIAHLSAEAFGCIWHETPEEYDKIEAARSIKEEEKVE